MQRRTARSLSKCVVITPLLVAVEAEIGEEMTPATEVTGGEGTVTEDAMVAILVITIVEEVAEDAVAAAVAIEDIVEGRTEAAAIETTETTVIAAEITEEVDPAAALAPPLAERMSAPLAAARVKNRAIPVMLRDGH
mmetsp:Transcript_4709/g.8889  ORF Transcript_4709/g.8889 Transcript_4709/m.8889 type:complete len:137 (-) Transcript_4709:204-614(-)